MGHCACSHPFLPIGRQLKFFLQEYQENEGGLTVENTEISQIINLFGCKNSTVVIKGKVNAVTIGEYFEYASVGMQGIEKYAYS